MKAKFYLNKSDERYLNKSIELKYDNIPIQVLEPSSVVRPSLRVSSGLIGQGVNYLYVSELERYYFIKDWIMENGHITLECEVDVLMSFKSAIKNQNVIVSRQESIFNTYQNDDRFKLYNYPATKVIRFNNDNGFDFSKTNYVLCVVGDVADI